MAIMCFPLLMTYSQIAVFDPSLDKPFNDWTQQHVDQGFSWRPGSVSFAPTEGSGKYFVEVCVTDLPIPLSPEAARIIETPFTVPPDGRVEIASISEGKPLHLEPGTYSLRFESFPSMSGQDPLIRFLFTKAQDPSFAVLRADAGLSPTDRLLLSAEPA